MKQLDIYDLYLETLDAINIDQRGQLTIDRFNRWARKATKDFVDYFTGRTSEEPTPQLGLLRTQKVADYLFPIFRKFIMPYRNGLAPLPKDYDGLLSLRISGRTDWKPGNCDDTLPKRTLDEILNGGGGFRGIDVLSHDEIPDRVNTHIPLLKNKPCAEQYAEGFMLYNVSEKTGSVFYAYTCEVPPIELAMTLNEATRMPEYNKAASKNPPFNDIVSPYLARKIADYFFTWTREPAAMEQTAAAAKSN